MRAMRAVLAGMSAAVLAGGAAAAGTVHAQASFQATLQGQSRVPHMTARWRYSLRALDASGRPVAATAKVQVLAHGRVVDTVGLFSFSGSLHRTYRWSPALDGSVATMRARVTGPGGARTALYRVRVQGTSASTGRPRFRISLMAASHAPSAGTRWSYVVRARDAQGRAVGGTAIVRVVVNGKVVDTVGWFSFNGTLRRSYRWSSELKGQAAVFLVKVIGPGGKRTVGYGVRVR
jgi:hypothetical protein